MRAARVAAAVVAFVALVPIGFLHLTSGLVVPMPWLGLLWLLFVAEVAVAVVLARRRSWWVLAVPVVSAAVWWGYLVAGERLLGWTA